MRPPTKRDRIWASLCRRNSDRGHAAGRAARRRCASLVTAGRRASGTSEQRVALQANLKFRLIATITVAETQLARPTSLRSGLQCTAKTRMPSSVYAASKDRGRQSSWRDC
ncbi:hypothetical protein EBA01_09800 [Xanthomonas oryzae pv. oryzae]|nr:hypothetical protein C0L89_09800 [Xanthomonas oryzae pv. oryzae]AVU02690.1 hypothetical protein C0L90_09865 [Xanthomonas oryzae pv. oryzae]QBN25191.1 hypothetical protein EBA00_12645 [Xanthomonas oryzae pv. oryzae]QBN28322.1 hypothetical protein EBA01_09800 [Xanthomonas oryzae pv. oryzae]QBN32613.1 hypothetical protein EBA02_14080 [Xanthomonas oryzae pv. oryzae]